MLFHGYYLLHQSPLIVSTWDDAALRYLGSLRAEKPAYCLVHVPWHHGVAQRMMRKKLLFFSLRRKGIRPLLITNSPQEEIYRRRFGVPGFRCISYVYTDEKEYVIQNETPKRYDAVYAAQLRAFKRIELAAHLEKLFVLTYTPGRPENDLPAFCPAVQHASYNKTWVDAAEKNRIYNQSRVGLCLSAEEGPMLASLEYQLTGLPVVSTPSKGGRDTYYHPESCLVVEATPQAVKAGVLEMARRNPDPAATRQRVIRQLEADRRQYVDQLTAYVQQDCGAQLNPDALYTRLFSDPRANFIRLPPHYGQP